MKLSQQHEECIIPDKVCVCFVPAVCFVIIAVRFLI